MAHHQPKEPLPWYAVASVVVLVPVLLLSWLRQLNVSMQRAGWSKSGPATIAELTDSEVRLTIKGKQTPSLPWTTFSRAIETPSGFLLVQADDSFVLLPKRACPAECPVDVLRTHLAEKIPDSQMEAPPVEVAVGGAATLANSSADTPRHPQANQLAEPVGEIDFAALKAHEKKAMLGVGCGMLMPMLMGFAMIYSSPRWQDFLAFSSIAIGIAFYLWGCWHLAASRGFTPTHGVVVGIIPVGVVFLATRAKPLPGERINRKSFRGLLATPLAKTKDMRSGR